MRSTDCRTHLLKNGDIFAIFDRRGDIRASRGGFGLYHQDTRFLSHFRLVVANGEALLLNSGVSEDNIIFGVELMTAADIRISRSTILWQDAVYQHLRLQNESSAPASLKFSLEFAADFTDIFEARGCSRKRRGRTRPAEVRSGGIVLGYEGLDGRVRNTCLFFDPSPDRLTETQAEYASHLQPGAEASFCFVVGCGTVEVLPYERARTEAVQALRVARAQQAEIVTSNPRFNEWIERSIFDLHMLRTETVLGSYPYAGIPWYSTAFGRDGIITALECLWFDPSPARGVLAFLAATQAEAEDPERDAEPGKIVHETRSGEMAALGEVPYGRYYGSIDSTPLFVMLAGAYYERTADLAFVRSIWPNVQRALAWIERSGDLDGDGFVEYARRSSTGLLHQGWKDSADPIFHEDGKPAAPPIALCEVQGYVYAAKRAAAALATAVGEKDRAVSLRNEAEFLRQRFEESFWCEDLGTYALALDGEKRPCRVRSSNAGHCLFTGIANPERARRVAEGLTSGHSFTGWGIRTLAAESSRYDAASYHNGSVWPHDNAIIAAGFARYGLQRETAMVLSGLFEATDFFDRRRMPELFCGFERRAGEGPKSYPVACSPQAWAAGAVFLLLQSCLGLQVNAAERRLVFAKPILPPFLESVTIREMRIGDASVDLRLIRNNEQVEINVLREEGSVEVVVLR